MSEKIINKIRKLFNHAEGARTIGNIAEAETAAALAHELLLKHKLDMATIERAELDQVDPMETRHAEADEWGQRSRSARETWSEQLASVVAKAHFCRMAVNLSSNTLTFFGRKSDIEVAVFVFTWLARTAARIGKEELRTVKAEYRKVQPRSTARGVNQTKARYRHRITNRFWPGDRRFLHSFHEGFRFAISVRYAKQRLTADADGVNALVLRKSDDDVKEYVDGKTATARSLKRQRPHQEARARGWKQGNEVNLDLKGLQPTSKPLGLLES